MTERCTYNWCR